MVAVWSVHDASCMCLALPILRVCLPKVARLSNTALLSLASTVLHILMKAFSRLTPK